MTTREIKERVRKKEKHKMKHTKDNEVKVQVIRKGNVTDRR